ncbi:hypothetical protein ACPCYY_21050 [Bacillus pumilus]
MRATLFLHDALPISVSPVAPVTPVGPVSQVTPDSKHRGRRAGI